MPKVSKHLGACGGRLTNIFRVVRRTWALLAAAALLNAAGPARAATELALAPSGQVALAAGLLVDGLPAVAGQTVFTASLLGTTEHARGILELGNRARLELSERTAFRLDFTAESVGGALDTGGAQLSVPRGVAASLTTTDAAVMSDTAAPALFTLRVSAEGTTLTVQAGRVEMRAGGATRSAGAGETLHASPGSQPTPSQGNSFSGGKRAGLFVGIAAAVAAVILIVAGRDGGAEEFGQPCTIVVSGTLPTGC